ncbi:MAG TPA: tryptophan 2,3-dioxygenase family protein [Bacteroidia bacterium]
MELKPEIIEKIKLLDEKYASMGQDLNAYLEGLLYADYLTYWNYIHLDTLLSLQNPLTKIADEEIFIMYHQITELYFKLCIHEFKQICNHTALTADYLITRINRINRYFDALALSFDIMSEGMEKEQFLKFRMSLLPASGFQSAQYRMIEVYTTPFTHLMHKDFKGKFPEMPNDAEIEKMFDHIYWKEGATELATGKKTLTLVQFEEKYAHQIIALAKEYKSKNTWMLYKQLPEADQKNEKLIAAFKNLDVNVNVNWPLAHYKTAVAYLQRNPEDIAATGGTNWQKYLPPRFQKRMFFPALWTDTEKEEWGKQWVKKFVFNA